MTVRLYTFFRSSAAFRVRIALNLKGADYEAVAVHLPNGRHREADFLATNPQGTIPVLDDDGTVLWQSLAIIEYLDSRYPEPRLIPLEPVARARVQALAQLIACEIHPLNNLRVLRYLRAELKLDEAGVARWYQHWVAEGFRGFEVFVSQWSGGRYCFGDSVSIADVCIVPQVYNARRFECDSRRIRRSCASPTVYATSRRLRAAPEQQPDAE
jgi:maleylacetoacetate isomerase